MVDEKIDDRKNYAECKGEENWYENRALTLVTQI
jgi:hypothetical protein